MWTKEKMFLMEKMCPWGWTMVGEEVGPRWFPKEEMGPRRRWAYGLSLGEEMGLGERWALGGMISPWGEESGMVGRQ